MRKYRDPDHQPRRRYFDTSILDTNKDPTRARREKHAFYALLTLSSILALYYLTPARIMVEQNPTALLAISTTFFTGVALFAAALAFRKQKLGIYSAVTTLVSAGIFATWGYFATRPGAWEQLWIGLANRYGGYLVVGFLLLAFLAGSDDKKKK